MTVLTDRDASDAELEQAIIDLRVLRSAVALHHLRALRLIESHRLQRCVGVQDLARACEALQAQRDTLSALMEIARRVAKLLDRRRGDGLAVFEAQVERVLADEREPLP